jgi:ech hydrogenase subunit D
MKDEQRIINLTLAELLPLIQQCRGENYRLVQMHATTLKDDRIEMNYSLVLGGALNTIRLVLERNDMLPSISTYFPGAAFYENEIHDLFGVFFTDINLDYQGNFYRIAQKTPFAPSAGQTEKEA